MENFYEFQLLALAIRLHRKPRVSHRGVAPQWKRLTQAWEIGASGWGNTVFVLETNVGSPHSSVRVGSHVVVGSVPQQHLPACMSFTGDLALGSDWIRDAA
ncbi:hypothetical protein LIA77_11637 [Sarocladium implicatum]|nr:hypothetical protein LIA77_11637 [Sarocladium implicatum]